MPTDPPEPVGFDRGPYYTAAQVAEQLGIHIDTLRRVYLAPNGDLPCHRLPPSGTIRIAKTDLDAWIERSRLEPPQPATPQRRRRRRT